MIEIPFFANDTAAGFDWFLGREVRRTFAHAVSVNR